MPEFQANWVANIQIGDLVFNETSHGVMFMGILTGFAHPYREWNVFNPRHGMTGWCVYTPTKETRYLRVFYPAFIEIEMNDRQVMKG